MVARVTRSGPTAAAGAVRPRWTISTWTAGTWALVAGIPLAVVLVVVASVLAGAKPYAALGNTDPGVLVWVGAPLVRVLVDIAASLSRVMNDIVAPRHAEAARRFRALVANYEANRDLVLMGAYRAGTDPELDRAIAMHGALVGFLMQRQGEIIPMEAATEQLLQLIGDAG